MGSLAFAFWWKNFSLSLLVMFVSPTSSLSSIIQTIPSCFLPPLLLVPFSPCARRMPIVTFCSQRTSSCKLLSGGERAPSFAQICGHFPNENRLLSGGLTFFFTFEEMLLSSAPHCLEALTQILNDLSLFEQRKLSTSQQVFYYLFFLLI